MNVAVFASGNGTNFAAIVKEIAAGRLKVKIPLLVCDNPNAKVIIKGRRAGITTLLVLREDFASTEEFETAIISRLKEEKIELIVLAGFMRILSPRFVRSFKDRIINIHPSLLPAFKGSCAIKDAFAYGVKVTGVTVHFVDEKVDHGRIILQEPVAISPADTLGSLESKIHTAEHKLYPQAIRLIAKKKVSFRGRIVSIR